MAVIPAGDLKFKVILKAPFYNKSAEGAMEMSHPADTITTRAAIRNVSNYRTTEASSTTQLTTKEFIVRWSADRSGINKDWLVVYNGLDWIIDGVSQLEEGKNRFIKITAKTKERV